MALGPEQRKAMVLELADAVLKSWWTVVGGICAGLIGAVVALSLVPKWYEATAKIYVTPEISRELGRPLVAEDMTRRMAALKEAVLTDEYKLRLVQRVYPQAEGEKMMMRLRGLRTRVRITPTTLGPTPGPESLFAFDLTYRDVNPERAAQAVNVLAELYIEQNEQFRGGQAREVLQAAEDQAAAAKQELDVADRRLIEFRGRNRFETEDQRDANLRLMERRQGDLESNLASQRLVGERLRDLGVRLAELDAGGASTAGEVAELRRQLEGLLGRYSESHPEVLRVRRKLQDLLAKPGTAEPASADYPPDPQVTALQKQVEASRREIEALAEQEAKLRDEIAEYERRIAAVPRVQPELSRLQTERALLFQRYQDLRGKADQAAQALYLEETLKGERFELAQRAEPSFKPVSPQPTQFYTLGVALGLGLFVGPLLARHFLRPRITSEAGLKALADVPVLVTIPRIETPAARARGVRRMLANVALSAVCAATTVAVFAWLS